MPPMLHFDLSSRNQGDVDCKVTVQDGRVHIEMSETVGLDSGLGTNVNGEAKLVGKARHTLRFECDLGTPPSILSVNHQDTDTGRCERKSPDTGTWQGARLCA